MSRATWRVLLIALLLLQASVARADQDLPKPSRIRDALRNRIALAVFGLATWNSPELDPKVQAQIEDLQPRMRRSRFIGSSFFPEQAQAGNASRAAGDLGLIADLDQMRSAEFDPSRVHPGVRDFYEKTSRFDLAVTAETDVQGRSIVGTSNRVAKAMGNGRVPLTANPQSLTSALLALDFDRDGVAEGRSWTRTYANNGDPALIGYYRTLKYQGKPYVGVVFPYPVGNQTSVLKMTNRSDGGIRLSALDPNDPIAGDYFSRVDKAGAPKTTKPFTLIAQELDVYPHPASGKIVADHRFYGLGKPSVQLHYDLRPRAPGAPPITAKAPVRPEGLALLNVRSTVASSAHGMAVGVGLGVALEAGRQLLTEGRLDRHELWDRTFGSMREFWKPLVGGSIGGALGSAAARLLPGGSALAAALPFLGGSLGAATADGRLAEDPYRSLSGAVGSAVGAALGAGLLAPIPGGAFVGGLVGGMVGQTAGEWVHDRSLDFHVGARAGVPAASIGG